MEECTANIIYIAVFKQIKASKKLIIVNKNENE